MNTINQHNIRSIAKWANFLGIFFATMAALIVLFGLIFLFARTPEISDAINNLGYKYPLLQTLGSSSFYIGVSIFFVLIGALIGFTAMFQLKAASSLNKYLASNDEQFLYSGMSQIGKYFRFYVIISIISLLSSLSGLAYIFS
jgi:Family of unknown function (DUF5362)